MIITFYSYKGGVGRSQLAVNLATYLCYYKQKRILLLDCDLEAPGLHFYFNLAADKIKKGVIELFIDYVQKVQSIEGLQENNLPRFDADYIIPVVQASSHQGRIDLVAAGNVNEKYNQKVNNFNWSEFYEHLDGKVYVEYLKEYLLGLDYDYIFLDSRTGISDFSGICNIQFPDANVIVVSPTYQSLEGGLQIANTILQSPYVQQELRKNIIFPILSRVDLSIERKSAEWIDLFAATFDLHLQNLIQYVSGTKMDYVQNSLLDYKRDIAFEEQLLFTETLRELKNKSLALQIRNIGEYIETALQQVSTIHDCDKLLVELVVEADDHFNLVEEIAKVIINHPKTVFRNIITEKNPFVVLSDFYITQTNVLTELLATLKTIEGVKSLNAKIVS